MVHNFQSIPSISSFNRGGVDPSSTPPSQVPHQLMRGPLRETYHHPKSASLSTSNTPSIQQPQQHISKIPEKIKCVFFFEKTTRTHQLHLPFFVHSYFNIRPRNTSPKYNHNNNARDQIRANTNHYQPYNFK